MERVEKITETKACKGCQVDFHITDVDLEFYEKISPSFGGKKYKVPTPTFCPDCRTQRRMSARNFFNLYSRKCDSTGKNIISMYSPDKAYRVYDQDVWWGDDWYPLDFGQDYDDSRSFFDQFKQLFKKVPKVSLMNNNSENCDYSNFGNQSKNCYLVAGNIHNEDCMYGHIVWRSNNCVDCLYVYKSEFCYGCVDCFACNGIFFSQDCNNCSDSYFLLNCDDCHHCFGCVGLKNQKYHIFNKKYSEEEYKEEIKKYMPFTSQSIVNIKTELEKVSGENVFLYYHGSGIEDSTGDYLYDSKNVVSSFDVKQSENVKYSATIGDFTDCYDCNFSPGNTEISYEGIFLKGYNTLFCHNAVDCYHTIYCDNCFNSSHLFGCVGLKNAEYCILNKQYTKEEYEQLVPKIIEKMEQDGEWGEFFPSSLSPFGYNETIANEYFPLTREEVLHSQLTPSPSLDNRGEQDNKVLSLEKGEDLGVGGGLKRGPIFNWSDYEAPFPKVEKIIPASKLPEKIEDIPDDILNWAIECEVTKKPFRVIKPELEFYRKHSLPVPKRHPDQRHLDRMNLRNPRKLYERNCDKCDKDIQTTYAPEREETVYCESCYNETVY